MQKISILILFLWVTMYAAKPTVAVLYFKNRTVSESNIDLSKAIADILLTELTNQKEFRVIEREEIERVANEQNFSESYLVDPSTAPSVGKLIGATYLFTGSYIIEGKEMILTMKMVAVETGEVVAGDNLTGENNHLSKLIAKISQSALAMLSKEGVTVSESKSSKGSVTIEEMQKYNAVLSLCDKGELEKARTELRKLGKDFSYAGSALKRIESELAQAEKIHRSELQKLETDTMSYMDFVTVASNMMMKMEYSKLYDLCQKARVNGLTTGGMAVNTYELIEQYAVTASVQLKLWDVVITDGTAFLKTYPSSLYYSSIKMNVNLALQNIATENRVVTELQPLIDELTNQNLPKDRMNYLIGKLYYDKGIFKKASLYFDNCDPQKAYTEESPADKVLFEQIMCFYNYMNIDKVKKLSERFSRDYPESPYLEGMKSITDYLKTIE